MEVKWIQVSFKTIRKWALFIILCASLVLGVLYWTRPQGSEEAKNSIAEANAQLREAAEMVHQTQNPQDATFLEMASDALEGAKTAIIENDFQTAIVQSRRSVDFSKKIMDRHKEGAEGSGLVRFDEIIGDVQVRRAEAKNYEPANKKMLLAVGDVIKTSPRSSCRVIFQDGMTTIVSPNSLVTIKESDLPENPSNFVNLRLDTGTLTLRSSELTNKNKPSILTKSGSAMVYHSSEVAVTYSAIQSNTALSVYDGRATAATGTKTQDVLKNQMVIFGDDQSLGNLRDLPPAPKLVRPENFSKVEIQGQEVAVTLGWTAVDPTASYHVELSPNILFTEWIHENEKYFRNQIEYANLKPGVYFWRVSSINNENLEGAPSDTWQFQIGEALVSEMRTVDNKPPKLEVDKVSVHGFIVIITGRTEKTATVQVDGERAIMDLETGKFNFTASMDGQGIHKIHVVATDPAGNRTHKEVSVNIKE
ncbi:MAG: hypothetical protein KDC71_08250 [Acidobacteria bacterium]|nr:hypothetical protein [Acidobacteriota bacterium]